MSISTMRQPTHSLAVWFHAVLLAIAAGYFLSIPGATAQTSPAVCQANFSWANNDRRQNPCVVAAYVQGACVGGQWTVPALKAGQHYVGPTRDKANECICSTVAYNLVSACGLCQAQVAITWSLWSTNCTTDQKSIGSYPEDIPSGTSIPAWAYLDPSVTDNLDLALAASMADLPDSTPVAEQPSTGTPSGSAKPTQTTSGSNNPPAGSSGSSGPNIGAIVGGVVGGLVALGLIIVGAVFFFRRNSAAKKPQYETAPAMSSVYNTGSGPMSPSPMAHQPLLGSSPAPHSTFSGGFSGAQSPPPQSVYGGSQSVYGGPQSYAGSVGAPTPRPYNPDDPSTFPPSMMSHPGSSPTPVSSRPGQYSGVAEI